MRQISSSDNAELSKQVLALITLFYRPVTLKELSIVVQHLEDIGNNAELEEIIGCCGSFLTTRDSTIYFVHQSAKDFLLVQAAEEIFPYQQGHTHRTIFTRSLEAMSRILKRDICNLQELGCHIQDAEELNSSLLAALRYSCLHWIHHLCSSVHGLPASSTEDLQDEGIVNVFLKERYLYWLEALSHYKSIPKGIVLIRDLLLLVQVCSKQQFC
jgi:hypothetical protein